MARRGDGAAAGVVAAVLALTAAAPAVAVRASTVASPAPGEGRAVPPPAGTVWVEREAHLMGTRLRVTLPAGSREAGFALAGRALGAVRDAEARWSSWRGETRLSRLNRAEPGVAVRVPASMAGVLAELRRWSQRTGGAFDPAVGPLIDAWGLREGGRRPGRRELARARAASGFRHFRVDAAAGTATRLREDAWLDAGAFGKGLALARARRRLVEDGVESALLDFGGQLLARGHGPAGRPCWRVGVADPRSRAEAVLALELCDASASTTSGAERFVEVDGRVRTHVLDPRSGRPAPAWGSVTVMHEDPMTADLLSTALFVMGPEAGLRWARERGVAALFLEARSGELRRWTTGSMDRHLTRIRG